MLTSAAFCVHPKRLIIVEICSPTLLAHHWFADFVHGAQVKYEMMLGFVEFVAELAHELSTQNTLCNLGLASI